jgi:proline iminopeptidase
MLRISYLSDLAFLHAQVIFRRFSIAAILLSACASAVTAQPAMSGMVHTPDVDLAYDTEGHDITLPPVVAVNGGPGLTHAYMERNDLWTRLSEHRRVVFYDQRGNGRSTRMIPNAPQTLEAQVADLEALRITLRAETIDLVGDSFGGLIVLAYTLAYPTHVQHLIISDGLPGWKAMVHPLPDVFPDLEAQEYANSKRVPESKTAQDRAFRVHIRECFYSPEKADRYLSNFYDLGLNAIVNEKVSFATRNVDLTSQLPNIKSPTLILTGRFDMNVAPITAWRMANAIPGAQLHIFEHSGHLPSYEEPENYLRSISEFLSR